jgi:predicted nucleotidyltransferase
MDMGLSLKQLKQIVEVLEQFEVISKAMIFGSRAKGTQKNGSDIDLALIAEGLDFRKICRIGSSLDDLDLPYKIDIIDYNGISNRELKEHIDRAGVTFFTRIDKKAGDIVNS